MVSRDHHQHAQRREQRQREKLPAEEPARRVVAADIDQRHRHRQVHHHLEDVGKQIVDDQAIEREHRPPLDGEHGHHRTQQQGELRQQVRDVALIRPQEEVHEQDARGQYQQQDLWQSGEIVGEGRDHNLLCAT